MVSAVSVVFSCSATLLSFRTVILFSCSHPCILHSFTISPGDDVIFEFEDVQRMDTTGALYWVASRWSTVSRPWTTAGKLTTDAATQTFPTVETAFIRSLDVDTKDCLLANKPTIAKLLDEVYK